MLRLLIPTLTVFQYWFLVIQSLPKPSLLTPYSALFFIDFILNFCCQTTILRSHDFYHNHLNNVKNHWKWGVSASYVAPFQTKGDFSFPVKSSISHSMSGMHRIPDVCTIIWPSTDALNTISRVKSMDLIWLKLGGAGISLWLVKIRNSYLFFPNAPDHEKRKVYPGWMKPRRVSALIRSDSEVIKAEQRCFIFDSALFVTERSLNSAVQRWINLL